jgi:hypothetical protein
MGQAEVLIAGLLVAVVETYPGAENGQNGLNITCHRRNRTAVAIRRGRRPRFSFA